MKKLNIFHAAQVMKMLSDEKWVQFGGYNLIFWLRRTFNFDSEVVMLETMSAKSFLRMPEWKSILAYYMLLGFKKGHRKAKNHES